MKLPIRKLYTLSGRPDSEVERIGQAMDWLCSAEAGHLGEELLRKTYAIHDQPIIIRPAHDGWARYDPYEHVLYVCDTGEYWAVDGTKNAISLESVLVHELTHAADPLLKEHGDLGLQKSAEKEVKKVVEDGEIGQTLKRYRTMAKNTPYWSLLVDYIVKAADVDVKKEIEEKRLLAEHPDFIRHCELIERESVANENKILKIQGKPERVPYEDDRKATAADPSYADKVRKQRAWVSKMLLIESNPDLKEGIAPLSHEPAKQSWQAYIQDGGEFKLEKPDHPLLAVHKDGGRT